MEIKKKE
jgi:hypothetical protein